MQTRGEEIANSISHGLGLSAALAATPLLISTAIRRGDKGSIVGASVFAASMMLLYLASTVYHALPINDTKRRLRVVEHAAIFILIAGTYTPFTLGVLRGFWGWTLLGLVWSLALTGVTLKALGRMPHPIATSSLYLATGWLILIAVDPLCARLSPSVLQWLVAGGLAYTVGIAFFAVGSYLRYGHLIWHLFVMAGTACHYVAVLKSIT